MVARYIPRSVLCDARSKYRAHIFSAKGRGIPFLMSFTEWFDMWWQSGHWHERGCRRGEYCMARYGDKGPYEVGNVRICTVEENGAEQHTNPGLEATRVTALCDH